MVDVSEFFNNEIRSSVLFDSSDGSRFSVRIREIDIVPLLMELIGNLK
jgi:hypothetical protein